MHCLPLDSFKDGKLQCILLSDLNCQWPGLEPVYIDPYPDSKYKNKLKKT